MKHTLPAFLLAAVAAAQTYTVTPFGAPCGAALRARVVQNGTAYGIQLGVGDAHPNAVAVLVVGHQFATPAPLPGSQCLLLVDPRFTTHALVDANGHAMFAMRLPPMLPITVDFQAVVVRPGTRLVVEATNGVQLTGV